MNSVSASLDKAVDVTRLPSLPQVLFRLLDACESADSSMGEIAALIRQDAALASRVIALGSSPVYARQHSDRRMSLEQGLMLLGLDTMRTLALTAAVYQYMDHSLGAHSPLLRRFWHDALLTATLAERLAQLSGYPAPHEAYLGGLISNIGQIALLTLDPQGYGAVLDQSAEPESLLRHERSVFGHDHAELGAHMLQQAGRRGPLADAVRFHHADTDELADAHHLVQLVAGANGLLGSDEGPSTTGVVAADRMLGLIPSLLEEVYAAASEQAREACASLGIEPQATAQAATALSDDQLQLARRLGELNVIAAVRRQWSASDDLDTLLTAAHLASTLIFGTHELGYFLLDRGRTHATGHAVTVTAPIWAELELQLPAPHSLIGSVLADARTRCHYPWNREHPDSFKPSVLDRELAALLDRQGLIALALRSGTDFEGAIVIGVNPEDEQRLEERRPLLALFAQELATSIAALRMRIAQHESALEAQASEYHLQARSVVHEAKNPLSIINNYLAILGRHLEEGNTEVSKDLRIIGEEITRVGAILRSLTEAAEESGQDGRTDLNTLIRDVANLLRPTLIKPAELKLELTLDNALPTIAAPRNSIKQILVNLVKNAAEALAAGQTITIQTEDGIYVGKAPFVAVVVADDGPGLPPQVLESLFEPVASTKGKGHSGLGLSITKRLVDELGGRITCHSSPAQGTRFQILIPRQLPDEQAS